MGHLTLEAVWRGAALSSQAAVVVARRRGGADLSVDEGVEAEIRAPAQLLLAHGVEVALQEAVHGADAHVLLAEEGVHVVDICHELAVAEGEISHVPARLGSCQHLQQRFQTCVAAKGAAAPVASSHRREVFTRDAGARKTTVSLVEFAVDIVWVKLFQKVFEVQSVNGHDLCAPPLPFISRRGVLVAAAPSVGVRIS